MTLVKLENCVYQSKLQGPFLPPPFPTIPPPRADPDGRGGDQWTQGVGELESHLVEQGGQSKFYKSYHREQTGIPAKSLQLSNTGFFFRSLADKRRLGQWSIDIA